MRHGYKRSRAPQQKNMQSHPSPKCKAARACKAAHARKAGLTHDNALLAVMVVQHVLLHVTPTGHRMSVLQFLVVKTIIPGMVLP
jgi:hypothetical protein